MAIILIIQTELEPRKLQSSTKSTNLLAGIKGSIGLSWLLPILCAMCTQLVHNIIGEWPKEWWLKLNTFDFVLFIITEMLFVLLFLLLFLTLIKKLLYLARKRDKHSAAIVKRWVYSISILQPLNVNFLFSLSVLTCAYSCGCLTTARHSQGKHTKALLA